MRQGVAAINKKGSAQGTQRTSCLIPRCLVASVSHMRVKDLGQGREGVWSFLASDFRRTLHETRCRRTTRSFSAHTNSDKSSACDRHSASLSSTTRSCKAIHQCVCTLKFTALRVDLLKGGMQSHLPSYRRCAFGAKTLAPSQARLLRALPVPSRCRPPAKAAGKYGLPYLTRHG